MSCWASVVPTARWVRVCSLAMSPANSILTKSQPFATANKKMPWSNIILFNYGTKLHLPSPEGAQYASIGCSPMSTHDFMITTLHFLLSTFYFRL
jgi:hypothetical protein